MANLTDTIEQAISDFDDIEAAIKEQGVDVPYGTDTSEYGNKIRQIKGGGDVDQTYNPESQNAQSGIAVAEALAGLPVKYIESLDPDNKLKLRDLESGTYILYGKFNPFNGSTSICTFSTGMLVSVIKTTDTSYIQIFYSKNNAIQYLEITDESYTRKDAKLVDMETRANLTSVVDENSDDTHYPSAKAVFNAMELKRIESLDTGNMKYMRDIDNGYYIMHGYFQPFPNSKHTVIMDTMCVSVAREEEGSHLMAFSPLNFKIRCYEILVDDTAEDGFVFNSWVIKLLDLLDNSKAVTTVDESSDDEHYPTAKAVYKLFDNYCQEVNAVLETIVNGEGSANE